MTARVQDDGETSAAYAVTNGVKQGTDGKLLNQRRLLALKKVKHTVLKDFLFADDCALNAKTDRFSGACDYFGLIVSTKKTEVDIYQPRSGKLLNPVDKFTHLGSTMSRQANIDEEVNYRIAKASNAFGRH
ncbi:hypothetical protein Bbelb_391530 [Branchiostoma belcheri]|nr:hypothetical protein Bbelb_391530 [Branchiostoma belcheri]